MLICKRCSGYIDTTYHKSSDPSCINCGCVYPELGPSANGTKRRKGLRETIRYTGKLPHKKELLGYITYTRHPHVGHVTPKLTIECPHCTKEIEVLTALADPSFKSTAFVNGYRTAKQFITCPTGHSFRLKVNKEGTYSWAE